MSFLDLTALDSAMRAARIRRDLPPPHVRRTLRQQAGLSMRHVATSLGVTETCVSRWEQGKRFPKHLPTLVAYAALLQRLATPPTATTRCDICAHISRS